MVKKIGLSMDSSFQKVFKNSYLFDETLSKHVLSLKLCNFVYFTLERKVYKMKTTLGQVRFFGTCEHSKNIIVFGPKCWPFPCLHVRSFFLCVIPIF